MRFRFEFRGYWENKVKNSLMKERPLQIKYQGQTIEIILRERDCYPNEEI